MEGARSRDRPEDLARDCGKRLVKRVNLTGRMLWIVVAEGS